jgi:hypothetical protein
LNFDCCGAGIAGWSVVLSLNHQQVRVPKGNGRNLPLAVKKLPLLPHVAISVKLNQ